MLRVKHGELENELLRIVKKQKSSRRIIVQIVLILVLPFAICILHLPLFRVS